jgi:uncharacterized membrane-anchored protein YjiN (DUF445 family)
MASGYLSRREYAGGKSMGDEKRNRLGSVSLLTAISGFLIVELQPWLPLASIGLFRGLSLKGLLEAFFEASMAGAFADWFAVTALFKDPLGIKLPHTNILAKNKDAIADAIPRFLTGFVRSDAVVAELAKVDYASKVSEALAGGDMRDALHDFLRSRASELLVAYGGGDEKRAAALHALSGDLLAFVSERVDAPAAAASLLAWARKERFDERALEALAEYARMEIGRNSGRLVSILTPLIKRNAGWQGLFIGTGTVERFITGVQDELAEIKSDKANEARRFILSSVASYAERLAPGVGDGSGDREWIASAFRDALAEKGFRHGFSDLVAGLLSQLGGDLGRNDGRFIALLERVEDSLASRLGSDEYLRGRLNAVVASLLGTVFERGRVIEAATDYIARQLRSTDERYFVDKIEEAVWNDLQYIRVNGAVVGGLVGLAIALAKAALGG